MAGTQRPGKFKFTIGPVCPTRDGGKFFTARKLDRCFVLRGELVDGRDNMLSEELTEIVTCGS